jgi:hypothetical protein
MNMTEDEFEKCNTWWTTYDYYEYNAVYFLVNEVRWNVDFVWRNVVYLEGKIPCLVSVMYYDCVDNKNNKRTFRANEGRLIVETLTVKKRPFTININPEI